MDNEVPPIHTPPPPPIVSAPPPIIVNTPPPQRSGGRGWMFLSFALLIVVGLMFFGRMARMVAGASKHTTGVQSGRYFEEITVENPSASDKIVIIDLDGIITSEPWDRSGHSMVDTIADQLKLASKDDSVKAVILKVNSPGGEVMA